MFASIFFTLPQTVTILSADLLLFNKATLLHPYPNTNFIQLQNWVDRMPSSLQNEHLAGFYSTGLLVGVAAGIVALSLLIFHRMYNKKNRLLQESEQKFRDFFNSSQNPSFIISKEGEWRHVNNATLHLFGYDVKKEFMAKPTREFYLNQEEYPKHLKKIEKQGVLIEYPVDMLTKQGTTLHTLITTSAILHPDQSVVGYQGTIRDITTEKQTQLILKDSQERLDLALSGTGIGIWDWNIDSGKFEINERWIENLGYQIHQLEPITIDSWNDLIHPDDLEKSFQCLAQHFAGDVDQYECELRIQSKNSQWRWMLSQGKVVDHKNDGSPLRMVGTYLDITERIQIKNEIQEYADQLEALHAVTTTISASLSLDEVLNHVLDQLSETLEFISASIFLLKADHLEIATVKDHRHPELVVGKSFPTDNPLFQEILKTKKPIIIDNAQRDKRFQRWGKTDYVKGWMGIPLVVKSQLIGYITLDSDTVSAFGSPDARLARIFASQAAQAIENARLYQQVQEYANQLESRIEERTEELSRMVDLMAGREIRMVELKQIISKLQEQIINAGLEPEAMDPLDT